MLHVAAEQCLVSMFCSCSHLSNSVRAEVHRWFASNAGQPQYEVWSPESLDSMGIVQLNAISIAAYSSHVQIALKQTLKPIFFCLLVMPPLPILCCPSQFGAIQSQWVVSWCASNCLLLDHWCDSVIDSSDPSPLFGHQDSKCLDHMESHMSLVLVDTESSYVLQASILWCWELHP